MADFTEREKKTILEAAEGQKQMHTYLLGINGQDGFCKLVERKLESVDILENRSVKLNGKVQWIIGILIGASIVIGGSFGIPHLIG